MHAESGRLPFANVSAKTLAISITDDPYATIPAIERLLAYFINSTKTHLRIAPEDIGEQEVGHFAFFRSAYQATLWPIALFWLQKSELAPDTPGRTVPPANSKNAPPPQGQGQAKPHPADCRAREAGPE